MKGFVLKNDKIKHFVERERQNAAFGVQASAGLWLWIPDISLQQAWFEVLPLTRHQQPPSTCQSSCLCGPAGSQMCDISWGLKKLNSPEFHFSPIILLIFFPTLTMLQLHLGRSCAKGLIGTNGARNLEGVEGTKRVQGQQLEHGLGPVAMGCAAPRAVPALHPLPWYSHDGNLSRFRHGRTAGCLSN